MWRFHRKIYPGVSLLSCNRRADLGPLGPLSCLATILAVEGGGCTCRWSVFITAPLHKSVRCLPAPEGFGILTAVVLPTQLESFL